MLICVLNAQHLILIPMVSKFILDMLRQGVIKFIKSILDFDYFYS